MSTGPTARHDEGRDRPLVGSRIGRYRVVEEIGRGGMGVVYRAVHPEIGQLAAVKVLSDGCARDATYLRRFTNEARAVSRVDHPGLVKIFDFGQTPEGVPYILMEHLQGELLRHRLRRLRREGASMDLAEAMRIVRQAASALTAAHDKGIVHRDLKPENMMLVADDEAPGGERVKLLDFGIARFVAAEGPEQTSPGAVIGTAAYMSPEQCLGIELDGRADVYALGVLLHEMIAGEPPFRGESADVIRMHLFDEPPSLAHAAPDLPDDVARLARRMLAKEPSLRPDMSQVLEAVRSWEAATSGRRSAATSDRRGEGRPAPARDEGVPTQEETLAPTGDAVTHEDTALTRPEEATTREETAITQPEAALTRVPVPSPVPRPRARLRYALPALLAALIAIPLVRALRARAPAEPPVALSGMVRISGAAFRMGSTPDEIEAECRRLGAECRRDLLEREQPPRQVTVSAFLLDARETDNASFAAWLDATAPTLDVREDRDTHEARFVHDRADGALLVDLHPSGSRIVRTPEGHFEARPGFERRPVVQVTWDAAARYCKARGKRLPTEAEWELAARGPSGRRFPWGDEPPRCDGVVLDRDKGGACAGQPPGVQDVGTSPQDRTPEGVLDLGGNAAEWVHDAFVLPYYPPCGACVDPRQDADVPRDEDLRLRRGGAWGAGDFMARGAMRARWKRGAVLDGLGFRCASR